MHDPETADRFLDIILKHTERLNWIIEDLLSLSRIERDAEKGEIPLEPGSLKEVLEAVVKECLPKAQSKDIELVCHCSDDITANINRTLLEQAIANLVDNAVKYSDAGKTVTIEILKTPTEIAIKVADQGCGIPKEHLNGFSRGSIVWIRPEAEKSGEPDSDCPLSSTSPMRTAEPSRWRARREEAAYFRSICPRRGPDEKALDWTGRRQANRPPSRLPYHNLGIRQETRRNLWCSKSRLLHLDRGYPSDPACLLRRSSTIPEVLVGFVPERSLREVT